MKLVDAASFFDRTPAYDPVTGRILFLGQVGNYDDSKRDAGAAYRRILSVRPSTVMPIHRTVRMLGETWIVGAMEPDGLQELHRNKYVLQMAQAQLNVSRLSGFLTGTIASTVWASPVWVKSVKQIEVSSEMPHLYDIAVSSVADVRQHDVLWDADRAYLVLAVRDVASGLLQANALLLEQSAPANATLTPRTYDPAQGAYVAGTAVTKVSLTVRWQSLYEYGSQGSERFQEGDFSLVLPAGTTVNTSTLVSVGGVSAQALAVMDMGGAVVLHARKV